MRRTLIVIASLLGAAFLLCGAVIGGYFDLLIRSGPGNPASGKARVYVDSGTNLLTCILSTGASCLPSGGAGLSAYGYYLTDGSNYYLPSLHMFQATLPNAGAFTWLNQGTATETAQNGSLILNIPGQSSNQRLRAMSASGLTQVTAVLMMQSSSANDCCDPGTGFGGLGIYESAHSTSFIAIGTQYSGGTISANGWSGGFTGGRGFGWDFANTTNTGQPAAYRILMDATNHIIVWQFSKDGVNFMDGLCEAYTPGNCSGHPYATVAAWTFNVVGTPYWPDQIFYTGTNQDTAKNAKVELLSWEAH